MTDDQGNLAATASATMRYHDDSRLRRHVFAGMASVAPDHRGKGLGKLVNALLLQESHARFVWEMATEQVSPDNPASIAMIEACGLNCRDGYISIGASNSGTRFTR